jgi:hypothetical protein
MFGTEAYVDSFRSPAHSLEFSRGEVVYPSQLEGNIFGRTLLALIGAYGRKQQLRNGMLVVYLSLPAFGHLAWMITAAALYILHNQGGIC